MPLWSALSRLCEATRASAPHRARGQIMVLFALSFVVLCVGVGVAADLGLHLVEKKHLQTAVDSSALAAARYLVAYSGDPTALTVATGQAQTYMAQYGYPTGGLASFNVASPATRQITVSASTTRPTLLVQLAGISQLTATATATASAELKADIYAANDVTGSMTATDMTNLKAALNSFIGMLGLDPADTQGPKLAVGQFRGERCRRINTGGYARSLSPQSDPTLASNWVAWSNWQTTTGGWCDASNPAPLTAYTANAGIDPPASGLAGDWNPYYPVAQTTYQLGQSATSAQTAANNLSQTAGTGGCVSPSWAAYPSLAPYGGTCASNGTSHTAGMATAWQELNSVRARGAPFRRVLILETDGTACRYETPFTVAQAETRATAYANLLKTTPSAFSGVEIFVVMFWQSPAGETCFDRQTDDFVGTLFPNCPNATSLGAAGAMSAKDTYLIGLSSSTPNTCDHYFPVSKTNASQLTVAYRQILTRIAVATLVS